MRPKSTPSMTECFCEVFTCEGAGQACARESCRRCFIRKLVVADERRHHEPLPCLSLPQRLCISDIIVNAYCRLVGLSELKAPPGGEVGSQEARIGSRCGKRHTGRRRMLCQ